MAHLSALVIVPNLACLAAIVNLDMHALMHCIHDSHTSSSHTSSHTIPSNSVILRICHGEITAANSYFTNNTCKCHRHAHQAVRKERGVTEHASLVGVDQPHPDQYKRVMAVGNNCTLLYCEVFQ